MDIIGKVKDIMGGMKDKMADNIKASIAVIAILLVGMVAVGGSGVVSDENGGINIPGLTEAQGENIPVDDNPVNPDSGGAVPSGDVQSDGGAAVVEEEPVPTTKDCPRCGADGKLTTLIDPCNGQVAYVMVQGKSYPSVCPHIISAQYGMGHQWIHGSQTCNLCGGSGQVPL